MSVLAELGVICCTWTTRFSYHMQVLRGSEALKVLQVSVSYGTFERHFGVTCASYRPGSVHSKEPASADRRDMTTNPICVSIYCKPKG